MDISESPDPNQPQQSSSQLQSQFVPPSDLSEEKLEMHCSTDRNTQNTNGWKIEMDGNLLQQFNCLGTRDHEDLIEELRFLFNNQLSGNDARFFLEMCNWNLQNAICCYLDFCYNQTIPSMKIVEKYCPGERLWWKIQNNGTEIWPSGCYLISAHQEKRIAVPALAPGYTCYVVAEIPSTSPPIMWRLSTSSGWCFGEEIWMIPQNGSDTVTDLAQQMAQLKTTAEVAAAAAAANQMNSEGGSMPEINIAIVDKLE